ncbi:putative nitrate reductase [NADH] [Wickerhamomyces ciferrii]|uniref:Nitrate reductase [NADH] n=1 Tax=Wickerhamomyces ciferrii (strain ATCC 14091 / BCRC 22168 / CBS 111 / JCM 3599 / NBRC 0793 / NRRL Y-1031 F-60-10) TaxID=1206466 RepID=K0KD99_WICCF|nr:putative nitrate reductase [NADH] [Wickerhamomyces ciferrii]CCH43080.1 putative nitrate reductase [NADH] [Wickerhamomyces ciferrii]
MEEFKVPKNPIQARLEAQRKANQSTSPSTKNAVNRAPSSQSGFHNIRVIPPVSTLSSQERSRGHLAPPNSNPITRPGGLPGRIPPGMAPSSSNASFPSINSAQRAGGSSSQGARKKVGLEPGCSPLDWARLNSSGQNLRGIFPNEFPLKVSKELLKNHKSQNDCWTVLKGKVYNITPYVKFHPGGIEEIMKCAGRDGTSLFNKYHSWVNFERMLENCFVGFYIG